MTTPIQKRINDMTGVNRDFNALLGEYRAERIACPKCGETGHSTTLAAVGRDPQNSEMPKDTNVCACNSCGDRHIFHDRVAEGKASRSLTPFEKAIEAATGESIESIKQMPISERRNRFGRSIRSMRQDPLSGREINKLIDDLIG